MKNKNEKLNINFILISSFAFLSLILFLPLYFETQMVSCVFGGSYFTASLTSIGLIKLFENITPVIAYISALILYFISFVLFCFILKNLFEKTKGKMTSILIKFIVLFLVTPFSFCFIINKNHFGILLSIIVLIFEISILLMLKEKYMAAFICNTIALFISPSAALPTILVFSILLLYSASEKKKKVSIAFVVLSFIETAISLVFVLISSINTPINAEWKKGLTYIIMLLPIIIILEYVFVFSFKKEKNKSKKSVLLISALLPVILFPSAFAFNNWSIYLMAFITGSYVIIFNLFGEKNDSITEALKKIANVFDKHFFLYGLLLVYLVFVCCSLQNGLGDIGTLIFTKNVF